VDKPVYPNVNCQKDKTPPNYVNMSNDNDDEILKRDNEGKELLVSLYEPKPDLKAVDSSQIEEWMISEGVALNVPLQQEEQQNVQLKIPEFNYQHQSSSSQIPPFTSIRRQ